VGSRKRPNGDEKRLTVSSASLVRFLE